jgi:hypothetical protein
VTRIKHECKYQQCCLGIEGFGWYNGAQRHFQQYFSDIVAVSFIGRGNQSIHRKPPLLRYTQQKQDTPRIRICFFVYEVFNFQTNGSIGWEYVFRVDREMWGGQVFRLDRKKSYLTQAIPLSHLSFEHYVSCKTSSDLYFDG